MLLMLDWGKGNVLMKQMFHDSLLVQATVDYWYCFLDLCRVAWNDVYVFVNSSFYIEANSG